MVHLLKVVWMPRKETGVPWDSPRPSHWADIKILHNQKMKTKAVINWHMPKHIHRVPWDLIIPGIWGNLCPIISWPLSYSSTESVKIYDKEYILDQARWLTPVFPALWEAEAGRSPKVGSSRPAWPKWRNPVSTKNTKLARHGGTCL